MTRRVIFKDYHSLGDLVEDTIAIRWLRDSHPEIEVGVDTFADEVWIGQDDIARKPNWPDAERYDITMDAIHGCNRSGIHVVDAIVRDMERNLGVRIERGRLGSDLRITRAEADADEAWRRERGVPSSGYWVVNAGCKQDFPVKGWLHDYYQEVIRQTAGEIKWVQVGRREHMHRPLEGAVNLLDRTGIRDLIRVIWKSDGVLTPISSTLHLATMPWYSHGDTPRPCVVIGGGREPMSFTLYPAHRWLSMVGTMDCCRAGGCWRSTLDTCRHINGKHPLCMTRITPDDAVREIRRYTNGRP